MYNPDDWKLGDLVIMEIDVDLVRATPEARDRNRDRELRMLVERKNTSDANRMTPMWQGKRGAIKQHLRNPACVTYIERVVAVSPDVANLGRHEARRATQVPVSTMQVITETDGQGHTINIPVPINYFRIDTL